jgi:hypothetical protein
VNGVLIIWLVWMAGVATMAFWRYGVVQREKRDREVRRSERPDRRSNSSGLSEQESDPEETQRVAPLGAEYRQQLIAAGLLKPAPDQPTPEQPA